MTNINVQVDASKFFELLSLDTKIALRKTFANVLAKIKLNVREYLLFLQVMLLAVLVV